MLRYTYIDRVVYTKKFTTLADKNLFVSNCMCRNLKRLIHLLTNKGTYSLTHQYINTFYNTYRLHVSAYYSHLRAYVIIAHLLTFYSMNHVAIILLR
jgi:hypothetical protein